jgi:glycosyltransferase involved in cell wall biosynthesis
VSELVAYKQLDYAIRAFAKSGRRLRVVGEGPEYRNLKSLAGGHVEFCGRVPDSELRDLYARALAFLMPGEEDFGITAVEALASGKPVVALGRGGVLESVPLRDPIGGVLYTDATESALEHAIAELERLAPEIQPSQLQAWASRFSEAVFRLRMQALIEHEPPV